MDPKNVKVLKTSRVKNKHAAPVQITAEQLLREAKERMLEYVPPPPKVKFTDKEELDDYRLQKRKQFEDMIRRNRGSIPNWLKYAAWEDSQDEVDRARSVYERALDVDHRHLTIWLKYAEMEMKRRQVNHARNIWDRATTIMPRVPQFWFKYTYMEEMLGNVAGARQVFERWMAWQPDEEAWFAYINMEMRYNELDRARAVYERLILVHRDPKNWVKYAKFEMRLGQNLTARQIFERAMDFFGEEHLDPQLFVAFAKFEENQKEYERARVIYKYALERIPKQEAQELFDSYTIFEKKFGDRAGIETVILSKRRFQYEEEVKQNPNNYDAWFDYLRLCESETTAEATREVYERAVANVPPAADKRLWRRYIYLWIYYAVFEELVAEDVERTREVYNACLRLIPHEKFTFAKMWLMYAAFEIRQKNVAAARKALGTALGKCPKEKLFKGYIELELELREFDRCRTLYGKFLEFNPANCATWTKFAELETELGDIERARAIYELAVGQPLLDMPEVLWKAYIDFEFEILGEYDRARELYTRLLEKTSHVKVWISFAQFEAAVPSDNSATRARETFDKADRELRGEALKADRLLLLEAWRAFEESQGDEEALQRVKAKMPRRVKKRREVTGEDGSQGFEEYYDYIYPDEQQAAPNLKLIQMAQMWKRKQAEDPLALLESARPPSFSYSAQPPAGLTRATAGLVDEDEDEEQEKEGEEEKEEEKEERSARVERRAPGAEGRGQEADEEEDEERAGPAGERAGRERGQDEKGEGKKGEEEQEEDDDDEAAFMRARLAWQQQKQQQQKQAEAGSEGQGSRREEEEDA